MAKHASLRRPRKIVNGILYLQCSCPLHNGKWLTADSFTLQTYKCLDGTVRKIHKAQCKAGLRKARHIRGGRVPVSQMRVWIDEIIRTCGGINAAARTLGLYGPQINRWLNGKHKRMSYASAQNILLTLKGIREGTITPSRPIKNTLSKNKRCRTCHCALYLSTPGCKTCDRRYYDGLRRDEDERLQMAG